MNVTAFLVAITEIAQNSPSAVLLAVIVLAVILAGVVGVVLWVIVLAVRRIDSAIRTVETSVQEPDSTSYDRIVGLINVSRPAGPANDDKRAR